MAVTDKSKGSHGISAFILEKGMKGFRPGKKENKLGMRASDTSEVIFNDCRVPHDNLLGAEGEGFTGSLKILDGGRISIAALALGMAQGALEAATKYAKQRKQFGQPISEFQSVQFKLADMATQEIGRASCRERVEIGVEPGRRKRGEAQRSRRQWRSTAERGTSRTSR